MISFTTENTANKVEARIRREGPLTLSVGWGVDVPELRAEMARRGIRMNEDFSVTTMGNWFRFALAA